MKMKWMGRLDEENTFPKSKIPLNAVQFLEPKWKFECYIPIIPIIIFILCCVYIKTNFIEEFTLNIIGIIIGFFLIIPFLIIHEFLHAICLPQESEVQFFYSSAGFSTVTTSPIPKLRYIVTLIFPSLVLGIIPLLIWFVIPVKYSILNSSWFILSIGNLGGAVVDFYNLFHAIKDMPRGSIIQISGFKCYYYLK